MLTYVAKGQGSGRKSSGALSPRRSLASPRRENSRKGVFKGGGERGAGDRAGSDAGEAGGDDDPASGGSVQVGWVVARWGCVYVGILLL